MPISDLLSRWPVPTARTPTSPLDALPDLADGATNSPTSPLPPRNDGPSPFERSLTEARRSDRPDRRTGIAREDRATPESRLDTPRDDRPRATDDSAASTPAARDASDRPEVPVAERPAPTDRIDDESTDVESTEAAVPGELAAFVPLFQDVATTVAQTEAAATDVVPPTVAVPAHEEADADAVRPPAGLVQWLTEDCSGECAAPEAESAAEPDANAAPPLPTGLVALIEGRPGQRPATIDHAAKAHDADAESPSASVALPNFDPASTTNGPVSTPVVNSAGTTSPDAATVESTSDAFGPNGSAIAASTDVTNRNGSQPTDRAADAVSVDPVVTAPAADPIAAAETAATERAGRSNNEPLGDAPLDGPTGSSAPSFASANATPTLRATTAAAANVPAPIVETAAPIDEGTSSVQRTDGVATGVRTSSAAESGRVGATGELALPPAVDPQTFANRLSQFVRQTQLDGRPLRITLNPPELGALRIEVGLENGTLHARLDVQTTQAQQRLVEHLPQLRDALLQQGTVLDRIDVQVDQGRFAFGSGTGQETAGGRDRGDAFDPQWTPPDEADPPRDERRARPSARTATATGRLEGLDIRI